MAKTAQQNLSERCIRAFKQAFKKWHPNLPFAWRATKGSGNQSHDEGDLELSVNDTDSYLIEHKATEAKQFTLKVAALKKAAQEAWGKGCTPVFGITFRDSETFQHKHFVVLQLEDWEVRCDE